MSIRREKAEDIASIRRVTAEAFADMPFSDGNEAELADRLRAMGGLTLSLVAEDAGEIVGHIAFSPVIIDGREGPWYQMAPVSVVPGHQAQGIGSALIRAGLEAIEALGAELCLVLGNPAYYTRFGFESVAEVSDMYPERNPNFMRLILKGAGATGRVTYHPAFG